jgi:class 3 adenylate cyclase
MRSVDLGTTRTSGKPAVLVHVEAEGDISQRRRNGRDIFALRPWPSACISSWFLLPFPKRLTSVVLLFHSLHVTAVFCDLVDLTGIAAKLDADEWRDLVGAYLDAASTAATKWGGKVVNKLGDGLIALFGYPLAQDNDLQRAAHAACLIQPSLAELNGKNT